MTFGSYLQQLRKSRKLRQVDLALKIGVSPVYVCDIENDRRYPPSLEKLRMWDLQLDLSTKESSQFYDLAGLARESSPPDITKYLCDNPTARQAIRRIIEQKINYNWDSIPSEK